MKHLLLYLHEYHTLTREQAKEALLSIGKGEVNHSHIAAFLSVYMMRGITVNELEGFREAMLDLCIPVDLSAYKPMDVCGTGGDGKDTFNISTCASFVVAAAGISVAKHGNHGISSAVGSSTIMEYFGYQFTNDADVLKKQMDACGICFMHAPLFHPAMKYVGPVRKELGLKTFFNMLGPLVNPAKPSVQMTGVFSLELARIYDYLFQQTNTTYCVIHSLEGYDEISLTSAFKLLSNKKTSIITPEQFGFEKVRAEDIKGGHTIEDSAKIFINVLRNTSTPAQKNVVIANAAAAIWCYDQVCTFSEAVDRATKALESGEAYDRFKKLLSIK